MTSYKAIIVDTSSGMAGRIIANTKSPGQYKGMTLEQFTKATKNITCFEIMIEEIY